MFFCLYYMLFRRSSMFLELFPCTYTQLSSDIAIALYHTVIMKSTRFNRRKSRETEKSLNHYLGAMHSIKTRHMMTNKNITRWPVQNDDTRVISGMYFVFMFMTNNKPFCGLQSPLNRPLAIESGARRPIFKASLFFLLPRQTGEK